MNIYGEEVLIIPANATCKMAQNPNCAIYECSARQSGQYWTRAHCRPLYVAFREKGKFTHLYKIQDIIILSFGDTVAIDTLDKSKKYPNFKKRINEYKRKTPTLSLTEEKYVFILSQNETIELPYTVAYSNGTKGKSGHEFRELHELIHKPQNGSMTVYLTPKKNNP